MKRTTKIGRLTCDYVSAGNSRICYILAPIPLNGSNIEEWAIRYDYNIVVICGIDWDNDLTPWKAPGVSAGDEDFQGLASDFLRLLQGKVMPEIESSLGISHPAERTLTGISLSGLFALWAWMNSDDFTNIGCISGSFWYDGFADWLGRKEKIHKNGYAYFSLGDSEGKDANPRYRTVEACTHQIVGTLRRSEVQTLFESTSGTHFAPFYPRLEKMFRGLAQLSRAGEPCSLEPAYPEDIDVCFKIVDDARKFQREQGFMQWTEDYPNIGTIRTDIRAGKGYLLRADGLYAGYMCIDFDGKSAYDTISGTWNTPSPYAVIHRMALHRNFRGRGISRMAFEMAERICKGHSVTGIRADTDPSNKLIQHILEKNGFIHCGKIFFQGDYRLAYDKLL
ncbi:GNAT family N-acetyltransferase [Culturomica massiliensis]|jgi:predicted alpha/beta superfamily hydrolase/GNAT superfamily N-acetyltransferase|uniref:GNAT family N-acetyltransferase n=1 Tax=Culturomica massiliensis TaxID=1841857 RepID=UPI002353631F|nr:GNAT family N-acetyltransferase [Culturomica massiliensis]